MTVEHAAAHPSTVGFVGLGAMGGPMARRLVTTGHDVWVCDLDPVSVRSAVAVGAHAASTPLEVGSHAGLVFTCLPSLNALRSVLLGPGGLAESTAETVVDFSTTGADVAREMAAALEAKGTRFLSAPITGNVVTAGNGKLGIMCSGPQAAYVHARACMEALASAALLYLGPDAGKAQTLKLLNNLLSATGMAASCEAMILGVKAGLDPRVMLEVINAGDASSSASRNKFARAILPRTFDFGARMAITAKDISLAVAEAEAFGVPMWIGQAVAQLWKYAVSQGGADRDGTSLVTYLEPWAGVEVRSSDEQFRRAPLRAATAIDDCVLLCGPGESQRLSHLVATRTQCTTIEVPFEWAPSRIADAVPATPSGRRLVINSCPMRDTDAAALAALLATRGMNCVDLLSTGPRNGLDSGRGVLLASGDADALAQARTMLAGLGDRVIHVDEQPGAAHLMQQIDGALFATLYAVSSESFVAGARAGLDPLTMTKILGLETGRNAASERIIPQQVATRRFAHGMPLSESLRDLSLAGDAARRLGVTCWVLEKTRTLYGLAAQLDGADVDVSRLTTLYERWSGAEVVAPPAPDVAPASA